METIWKVLSCFAALLLTELCNGLPLDLDHTYADGHTQFLTGLIAVLLTICGIVCLAGCLCCQRRNGFKEFRDSPIVVSVASNLDHGHVNPIANGGGNSGEFTIFTPLSPPHHNNNVFLANQQVVTRAEEDYKNEGEVSSWFGPNEKDFPRTRLKYIRELGKGWFGRVVEGTAQGIIDDDESAWTPVVVRILESTASSRQRVLFLHDAAIYRCPQHPNVLKLLGRSLESVPLLLLQEHCTKGDLKLYLKQQQLAKETFLSCDLPLVWCYQLTSAVKHLHSYNVTHPDLSTRNCQLTHDLTLKLGDYGCSMSDYPEDYYHGTENVPIRWCAPECVTFTTTTIQTKNVTLPGNIWSLGVCFWEVFECGGQPYSSLTDDEVVSQVLGPPNIRLGKPSVSVLYTDYVYRLMQLCWSSHESRPSVLQIHAMLADLMQVHENTKLEPSVSMHDFDIRWENLKPNAIVKTDNHTAVVEPENDLTNITVLNMNIGHESDGKRLSASLHNLAGSFDNLLDSTRSDMDSWLENVNDDVSFAKGLSEAMHDLDSAIAAENISSSDSETGGNAKLKFRLGPLPSSGSETEDETWRKRIERGAYTEKVRQKSRSVADLMVLTHIDCSESDSETPLPSLGYRNVRYGPKQNLENAVLTFGSEGNLLSVQDTFQEELKKLQEERRDSLLFVPDNVKESRSTKRLLDDLNSTATIEPPKNQVFNVYNVTISPKYSPIHAADLNRLINYKEKEDEGRNVLPDLVLNTIESKRDIPKLSEIIENNIELMDYIINKYDSNNDLNSETLNNRNVQTNIIMDEFQNRKASQISNGNISPICNVDNQSSDRILSEENTIYQKNVANNMKSEQVTKALLTPDYNLKMSKHSTSIHFTNSEMDPLDKAPQSLKVNGLNKEDEINVDLYKFSADLQKCNSTNLTVDVTNFNPNTENITNGVDGNCDHKKLAVNLQKTNDNGILSNGVGGKLEPTKHDKLEYTNGNDVDYINPNDEVPRIELGTHDKAEVEQSTCEVNNSSDPVNNELKKNCTSDVEEDRACIEVPTPVFNGGSSVLNSVEIGPITKSVYEINGIETSTHSLDNISAEPVKNSVDNQSNSLSAFTSEDSKALEAIDKSRLVQFEHDKVKDVSHCTINGSSVLSSPVLVDNSELLTDVVAEAVNECLIGFQTKSVDIDCISFNLNVTPISKDDEASESCTRVDDNETIKELELISCEAPSSEDAELLFYSLTDNSKEMCGSDITVEAINVQLCKESKSEDEDLSFSSLSDNIEEKGGSDFIVEAINAYPCTEPRNEDKEFTRLPDQSQQVGENDPTVEAINHACFEQHNLHAVEIKNVCDSSTQNLKENKCASTEPIVHELLVDDFVAQVNKQLIDVAVGLSQTNNKCEIISEGILSDLEIKGENSIDPVGVDDINLSLLDAKHPELSELTKIEPIGTKLQCNKLPVYTGSCISETLSFLLAEKCHNNEVFSGNAKSNTASQDKLCSGIRKELQINTDAVVVKEPICLEDIRIHIDSEYDRVKECKSNLIKSDNSELPLHIESNGDSLKKQLNLELVNEDHISEEAEMLGRMNDETLEDKMLLFSNLDNSDVCNEKSQPKSFDLLERENCNEVINLPNFKVEGLNGTGNVEITSDKSELPIHVERNDICKNEIIIESARKDHNSEKVEALSEIDNGALENRNLKNSEVYNEKSESNSFDLMKGELCNEVTNPPNQVFIEVAKPAQDAYLVDEKNRINSSPIRDGDELAANIMKVIKSEHRLGSMEDFTGIIDLIADSDKAKPLLAEVDSGFVTSCDVVEEMGRSLDESGDISSEAPISPKLSCNDGEVEVLDNLGEIDEDCKPPLKSDGSQQSTNMLLGDLKSSSDNIPTLSSLQNDETNVLNMELTGNKVDMLSKTEVLPLDSSEKSNEAHPNPHSSQIKNMSHLSSNLNSQISISGDESAVSPQSLIVKTQDFINNEILRYDDSNISQKLAFDLNSTEEEPYPNPIFRRSQESSVILGASDDYSIDFYTGLKTTNGEAVNGDMRYSLETWDNFLGKSFDEYSAQPQSLIFLDEEKREPHEISTTFILNSPTDRDDDPNATFVIDEENKTFIVEGEGDAVDVNDIKVELEDANTTPEQGYDNPGYWENDNSSGWFLHPQSNIEEVSGQMDIAQDDSYVGFSMDDEIMAAIRNELLMKLPQAQRASSEHIDDGEEYQTERNEVIVRYNCYNTPLSPIPEESYSELLHSGQSTPHCTINTDMADGDSDWSEPGIDPNSILDDDTHSPRIIDSPQKSVLNRHTPSQDSCCSNDTLFNLEELDRNIELGDLKCTLTKMDEISFDESEDVTATKAETEQQKTINESPLPPSPNADCTEQTKLADNTAVRDKPAAFDNNESPPNEEVVSQIVITDCGAGKVDPIQKEESSSSSETYLTVSDGYAPANVAPLNSPEDRPWKHIEASLTACEDTKPPPVVAASCDNDDCTLSSNSEEEYANEYENIEEMNLKNALATMKAVDYVNLNENIYDCIDERSNPEYVNVNEQQVKIEVHDYVNSTVPEVKTILYENLDHENYLDLLDDDLEVEYDSRGSVEDVFGPLTDIRFTGPSDSQMMTTSFSDSNDLGDEQDWDSGSDTRSSSSGEFIWKEGEHEASVKALHAAPQDEETHQLEENQDEESSSGSEEDGDGPEFVPSAWDKYATPTKSALRSPEKTLDRPSKKTRGVSFKKQKYHCVYEYPREPDSPVVQSFDLWQDPQHVIDWDLDRDTEPFLPATAVSDIETLNDTDANTQKNSRQHRNLYQISSVPDFIGSSIIDDDFYISSSAKPFDVFGGAPSSQFFPGRHCDWSDLIKNNDNVTPDSGVEDITPGSLSDSSDYVRPNRQILPLKTLAQLAINKGSGTGSNEIGGLRHTRNRLKLDLPPSPSAFTKTFTIEPISDPVVSRQVPTFTTFGKSRFVVQHVDTPEGKPNALNVSFEALPYKPIVDKHRIESVRGEASLLDSADEDSGIESCTLERKSS